jgi:hypothetical protein
MERLKGLPYLAWTPIKNVSQSGVTVFEPEKALSGVNLYKSGDAPEAYLMDMKGNILHTWAAKIDPDDTWSNIELLGNGDLIAFVNYERLIRVDWDSNIIWISDNLGLHHDLSFSADGDIYALARKIEYIPELSLTHPSANDYITILSDTGNLKKSISVAELLLDSKFEIIREDIEADYPRDTELKQYIEKIESDDRYSIFAPILRKVERYYEKLSRPKDFFHTNTINVLNNETSIGTHELFEGGDVLICIRNQNLIAIVDIEKEKIIWSWGREELEHPHDPVILESGNILIYDNGYKRKYSRIIELDPFTREIVWEYKSLPPEDFYSETRGSNQKLQNGNILIADSRNGRAFEITKEGEIVWEYYNPEVKIENEEDKRATIFRMRRFTNLKTIPL